jgi:uncharacterized membrane protein YciS (DUF1049 family)
MYERRGKSMSENNQIRRRLIMKKTLIIMIVLVFLLVGVISIACDSDNEKIQEANKLIAQGIKGGFGYSYSYSHIMLKGHSTYLKLIYQEEKKQTQMLQKIMNKLNIK